MKLISVVVAALLLVVIENHVAVAAEIPEHKSKNANAYLKQKKLDKTIEMLKAIGISDPAVTRLVNEIGSRTRDGYFLLYEEEIPTGNISLHYITEGKVGAKQFELMYSPKDSNMRYSARSNAIMIGYKLAF